MKFFTFATTAAALLNLGNCQFFDDFDEEAVDFGEANGLLGIDPLLRCEFEDATFNKMLQCVKKAVQDLKGNPLFNNGKIETDEDRELVCGLASSSYDGVIACVFECLGEDVCEDGGAESILEISSTLAEFYVESNCTQEFELEPQCTVTLAALKASGPQLHVPLALGALVIAFLNRFN